MKVAVSTDDGVNIKMDHFGEGKKFLIYEISGEKYKLVEERLNTSPEEESHGSEMKAKGIIGILNDIPILLGYQFGPNIMRIKDRFLPIVSRKRKIEDALNLVVKNYHIIDKEIKGGRGKVLIMDEKSIIVRKVGNNNAKDF